MINKYIVSKLYIENMQKRSSNYIHMIIVDILELNIEYRENI